MWRLEVPEVDLVIQCEPPKVRVEGWREKEGEGEGRKRGGGSEGKREVEEEKLNE